MSTLGPGATNFTTAAAYSHLGAFPAIFITGQKPILKSKQGAFQIVDTVNLFQRISKFSKQVGALSAPFAALCSVVTYSSPNEYHCKNLTWP